MVRFLLRAIIVLVLACPSCRSKGGGASSDAGGNGVSFVDDDYDVALHRARAEHRLLFVDAWAPWCHTCLSMKAFVFGDAALSKVAPSFVWASVDTEKPKSEPFLRKFPMKNWPTLWVIDPATEKPVLMWAGSVTAPELASLLESATQELSRAAPGAAQAAAAWVRGNHAAAEGRRDVAISEYQDALARAPIDWTGRAQTVDALASQLQAAKRYTECLSLSVREWPSIPPGTSRVNVAMSALGCAEEVPKDAPEQSGVAALVTRAMQLATDRTEPVLADDRSSLFEELVSVSRSAGDEVGARALARQWCDFLEAEAARAPNAAARAVFDSHRMLAYAAVGAPEKAIPMLEQSERDFPDDYNPKARLAKVYLDLGQLEAGLLAVKRAEAKVYGPRALRVLAIEADIWAAERKPREQKDALMRAVTLGEKLGVTGGYRELLDQLRARAASL
jgi:tetratricopeptide (TPR) repeat protein